MQQNLRAALRRGHAGASLVAVVVLAAALATGCDKAKEEPLLPTATVIMPGSPAPTDPSSAPSGAPPMLVSSTNGGDAAVAPAQSAAASGSITLGNGGPATGGTLSIIPGATTTTTTTTTTTGSAPAPTLVPVPAPTPNPAPVAPASPLDPTVLPPALTTRPAGPGRIGADPAASSPNDQPPAVPPGTKN
jgi:hypothetical protein